MDRKARKKLELLGKKLQQRRQQLAGMRRQPDEVQEIERLEGEIASIEEEMKRLRES